MERHASSFVVQGRPVVTCLSLSFRRNGRCKKIKTSRTSDELRVLILNPSPKRSIRSRNRSIDFHRAWYRLDGKERSPRGRFIIFPRASTRVNRPPSSHTPLVLSPPLPPCTCTLDGYETERGSEGASNGAGRRGGAAGGRAEAEEDEGRQGGSGGRREQYLGDFALYLEMSFVGSISSTIRTLSLCPGSVSGCWFCSCLSVSANRYTPYMSLPSSPPLAPVFSSSLSSAPHSTQRELLSLDPLFLSLSLARLLVRSLPAARTNVYVYLSHQPAMCIGIG